ncbi:MAG TPA: hypothetical protein DHV83_04530 [Prevotella sp.]|nr:hypothetical protein [Prevotella sp.]
MQCYPENNLFTLKELIPIEDLERLPAKVIAFFMPFSNVHATLRGVPPTPSLLFIFILSPRLKKEETLE